MTCRKLNSDQRLSLIIDTQREISAAGDDLHAVMQLIADRAQAIIGADGAMVNLADGEMLHTVGVSGVAKGALDERFPVSGSVGCHAIESGQPILIENSREDPRINQDRRARIGDESMICVPLFRGTEVIGTINVMSCSKDERLNEDDRQTLEMISVVLSAAVSRAAEIEARRAEAEAVTRFKTLFDSASLGILRLNSDGMVVEVNPAVETMLSAGEDHIRQTRFADRILGEHRGSFESMFEDLVHQRRGSFELEITCRTGAGERICAHLRAVPEPKNKGQACVVAMIENITERKHAEEALVRQSQLNKHQALHDPLTGLPNRLLFGERIDHAIEQARRNGTRLAVALMDLDRFKEINDSLGHAAGDQVLKDVGNRARGAIRSVDTVARLGGDEFGLLLPDVSALDAILPVLSRVESSLEEPVHVQWLPIGIEASIGVAVYPDHGDDVETLIRRADVAMYDAKRNGAMFTFYDEKVHECDVDSLTLVAELRRALSQRELVLHYQPKATLSTGRVDSVEALLRWQHPERGTLLPESFIPVVQETNLIGPLTLYVIEEALQQARRLQDEHVNVSVSVNLATRNVLDRDFPKHVGELLNQSGVSAELLELDVAESSLLSNPTRTKQILEELAELGVRLSIDDFGTGYSSLAYLRQLPIDEIKIDRSFVLGMGAVEDDAVIVRSSVGLGRNPGLGVVAEGAETPETWERLRALGSRTVQGRFLSHPLPPEELLTWLQEHADSDGSSAAAA